MNRGVPKGVGRFDNTFHNDGSIDFNGLERLLEHCINGGVDYFVVNGTTAENPTLSKEERYTVLDFVLEKNANRLPVVFGIGGNNTMAVAQEMSAFNVDGVSALLSASPYYNKPTQKEFTSITRL